MKVLIADDDQLILALLAEVLGQLGHTTVLARNGVEAVELCSREAPDAAILDFLMPRLSGLDALRAMRQSGHRIPTVLLTAIGRRTLREVDGIDLPDAILEKPFKRKDIERALARAVRST